MKTQEQFFDFYRSTLKATSEATRVSLEASADATARVRRKQSQQRSL